MADDRDKSVLPYAIARPPEAPAAAALVRAVAFVVLMLLFAMAACWITHAVLIRVAPTFPLVQYGSLGAFVVAFASAWFVVRGRRQ